MSEKPANVFDSFRRTPKQQNATLQMLYDYEKHYMELIKAHRPEIEFINQLHSQHTQEVKKFYQQDLPEIQKKLSSEPIDEEIRREWLKHLEQHMSKSFDMSKHFIDILTTKKVEEFNSAIREKMLGSDLW